MNLADVEMSNNVFPKNRRIKIRSVQKDELEKFSFQGPIIILVVVILLQPILVQMMLM